MWTSSSCVFPSVLMRSNYGEVYNCLWHEVIKRIKEFSSSLSLWERSPAVAQFRWRGEGRLRAVPCIMCALLLSVEAAFSWKCFHSKGDAFDLCSFVPLQGRWDKTSHDCFSLNWRLGSHAVCCCVSDAPLPTIHTFQIQNKQEENSIYLKWENTQ